MTQQIYKDIAGNAIRISEINRFDGELAFRELAIKTVVRGKEHYCIEGKRIDLQSGEVLLGNHHVKAQVNIASSTPCIGVCMDLSLTTLTEVLSHQHHSAELIDFVTSNDFPHWKNSDLSAQFNRGIQARAHKLLNEKESSGVNDIFFYSLAEEVVQEVKMTFQHYTRIPLQRNTSKRDIQRKLLYGKAFIDDCYLEKIDLTSMARESSLSKYHFLRLFQDTFGSTPYQYILERRLEHGKSLLHRGQQIQEVAVLCGFSDGASFSKAFRKRFAVSPRYFQKS